jgi:hypothetical protein
MKRVATAGETRKLERVIRGAKKPARKLALTSQRQATRKQVRSLEVLMRSMPLLTPPLPSRPEVRS